MTYRKQAFKGVSLLVTHYNRSNSLEKLLAGFSDLNIFFEDIIVSDDASNSSHFNHLKTLQEKFGFRLVLTAQNGGLANNLNKGQNAVTTPYTLYVQEDFIPLPDFKQKFERALVFMEEDENLDLVRFYAYVKYPYLQPFRDGFSLMLYKPWYLNTHKIYHYSDHPHLRRSNFFARFGYYTEGIKSDKAEYEMSISFIQNGGKALFYNDFKSLFQQENTTEEPSTVKRSNWRLSSGIFVSAIRTVYRQIKFNYDLHINKKFKK